MSVSVIMTVKNEGEGLRPLLESLLDQTLPPTEVVVCDGGSTDNTRSVLAEYEPWLPLQVVEAPGSNISQGRNVAIAAATHPIIATTDAGVVLSPAWLEEITRPIRDGKAHVVTGWFEPDPYTDFEVVMGVTVLPQRQDIRPEKFLPSSRSVAFRKEAWEAVGGYPEWLDFSEDLIFDLGCHVDDSVHLFEEWGLPIWKLSEEGKNLDGKKGQKMGTLKSGAKPVRREAWAVQVRAGKTGASGRSGRPATARTPCRAAQTWPNAAT